MFVLDFFGYDKGEQRLEIKIISGGARVVLELR